jgi:hypothetical protein
VIPSINNQFQAVRGAPIENVSVIQLAAMLETTDHFVVISHKYVGPIYSTTCYDETSKLIYRAHHPKGLLAIFKHLCHANARLRLLARNEQYVQKDAK